MTPSIASEMCIRDRVGSVLRKVTRQISEVIPTQSHADDAVLMQIDQTDTNDHAVQVTPARCV